MFVDSYLNVDLTGTENIFLLPVCKWVNAMKSRYQRQWLHTTFIVYLAKSIFSIQFRKGLISEFI